jgi:predicted nucleic acid-binding protein
LDSSALVKRVLNEIGSSELRDRLDELQSEGAILYSSDLGLVEVTRALRTHSDRTGLGPIIAMDESATAGVEAVPIVDDVIHLARILGPQTLRSLDAIHCATASLLEVDLVLTYDARLFEASEGIGIRAESPGVAV